MIDSMKGQLAQQSVKQLYTNTLDKIRCYNIIIVHTCILGIIIGDGRSGKGRVWCL